MAINASALTRAQNFRSGYLQSLGVTSVQVKDSLELILSHDTIDPSQFSLLVQQYGIPSIYRMLVWKLLLDLLPHCKVDWQFSECQRYEQFESMHRLVCILNGQQLGAPGASTELTPALLTAMCLLTTKNDGRLGVISRHTAELEHATLIASNFLEICDSDVDAYWLCLRFLTINELILQSKERLVSADVYFIRLRSRIDEALRPLLESLASIVKHADPQIHARLLGLEVRYDEFAAGWLRCRFAGLFPPFALERIWDRLIADRTNSMCVFVSASILINARSSLLSKRTKVDVLAFLTKLPECSIDRVLERAARMPRNHMTDQPTS
ncbi:hypothetical protein SARC_11172 [Sphaeroforma arctica JP610]|uniref:TBC1 domain family member 7 n=1 Tax=Sphaeroforma arctica JP610 TaxID=667725 RepID=A0A0L0FJV7_9EUKA|nr:hypothetical protein SARC_11172 [Sphaeroforma arctica JP610]KNC76318.1 hypothetical protein SARC_11172 [Sphaeroforma arctica JP610]|eukprot:XP_014150220.1 hypothetical protein SARC_11172 [Sphaeroforma arctica JP610]